MNSHLFYLIGFISYVSVIAFIGLWSRSSSTDPHLGGRSMNFWTTALSAHASDMSAWLFMSLPMLVWTKGVGQLSIAVGLWIGMGLNWWVVSRRLREKTAQANCSTLPAWFHYAFADHRGYLRILCALLSSIFLLHYLAAGVIAMGLLAEQLFGVPYQVGTLLAMILITAYTMKGGFNAVAWVDLFQALFLLAAIVSVPIVAWYVLPSSSKPSVSSAHCDLWQSGFYALGWGLGYFGMPHVLSKFMAIRSPSELRKSMLVGMLWQLLALGASVAIGLIASRATQLDPQQPELLFLQLVQILFHPLAGGLIFCAIMAANLSTMDSQLLVSASVAVEDLFARWLAHRSPRQKMVAFRIAILCLASLAWLIAAGRHPSVQSAVLYSWSGLGACYGPLVLWSLYARPSHWSSACLSLLCSAFTVFFWGYYERGVTEGLLGTYYEIPPLAPGFLAGSLALLFGESLRRWVQSRSCPLK